MSWVVWLPNETGYSCCQFLAPNTPYYDTDDGRTTTREESPIFVSWTLLTQPNSAKTLVLTSFFFNISLACYRVINQFNTLYYQAHWRSEMEASSESLNLTLGEPTGPIQVITFKAIHEFVLSQLPFFLYSLCLCCAPVIVTYCPPLAVVQDFHTTRSGCGATNETYPNIFVT